MKLKDLDKVIEARGYITIWSPDELWVRAPIFDGDSNDYYNYTRIDNPSIMERKIAVIAVSDNTLHITIE